VSATYCSYCWGPISKQSTCTLQWLLGGSMKAEHTLQLLLMAPFTEYLYITVATAGPLESRVLTHCSCCCLHHLTPTVHCDVLWTCYKAFLYSAPNHRGMFWLAWKWRHIWMTWSPANGTDWIVVLLFHVTPFITRNNTKNIMQNRNQLPVEIII